MNTFENLNYYTPQDILISSVHSIMKVHNMKSWQATRPLRDSCIYYILKGEYTAKINGRIYHVKDNDILFLPKTTDYTAVSISPEMEYIHIFFNTIPSETGVDGYFDTYHVYNMPVLRKQLLNMCTEYNTGSARNIISCKKIMYDILDAILSEEIIKTKSTSDYNALKLSIEYLESNYSDENITIDYLANLSNYTPAHFINLFKKLYHTTPQKHLTNLRIDKAKQLLLYSSYSIIEIASMVGYSNAAYFSAAFKTAVGCSPANFRKNAIY